MLIGLGYYLKTIKELTWLNAILIKLAFIGLYLIVLLKTKIINLSKLRKK
jgi:hypothetical protein